ncbi:DNA-directed RNA polymerase subunit beta' [Candidatus Peregrinibacteria bacterium CG10_big_fil_rev_8_21_14_0_10_36_19]|nr:MAG: DNA-directed RNA polymerase subunit beta' [Candidatus Peregrinibacteria bacterium CG10_big_fil_rev_8_21_14_0_10_36_19]
MAHQDNQTKNQQQPRSRFDAISLSVASPEEIMAWSHGEVKKPETINYRTQKPERDGLFCEKIFGPTKNYECYCGKYKRVRYKGVICEKCGVEVTHSSVRRERMAHIKLAVPVTHIWFLRSTPSRLGLLLDLPIKTLEQVVYFAAYVVSEVDQEGVKEALSQLQTEYASHKKDIQQEFKVQSLEVEKIEDKKLNKKAMQELETEFTRKIEELDFQNSETKDHLEKLQVGAVFSEIEYRKIAMKFGHIFKAGTGAETIREIIGNINFEELIKELKKESKRSAGQKKKKIIKRIKLAGSLLKSGIKPEWFIMTTLPVIPPDLRPMVQLDGGRFAASDLNDLYRRVINRNNRLKRLMSIGAPEVICRNEKRMLQEAVDTLLNNSARAGKTVFSSGDKRKLRSLSDMLKGKQGRFRQNLLGKRVDYSGRSVIIIGPKLKLHQCGVPKIMALELFKPFIIGRLIRDGYAHNIKNAEKLILSNKREVWDILEDVTKDHYVLLNRAPTLHRLGIQAFQPILIEGKAIQVHPLVCAAFNADFDGDQMAIHVPLSASAQHEAKNLMVSAKNLLKPSAGEPIVTPTQDMVLGCYYLTKMTEGEKGEGMAFADVEEAVFAYQAGHVHLQAPVKARWTNGEILETTVGRLIFNSFLPEGLPYYNESIGKKQLSNIVTECYENVSEKATSILADNLKDIGFKFATKSGISIAQEDMKVPAIKTKIIDDASEVVKQINNQFWKGLITDDERYNHTIKIWSKTKSEITTKMIESVDHNNNIYYMIDSGARGNWGQITQLCGIKGLVANPAGKTIELPIKSNLKEGFTILEYFIATHGGRKGKSDTALKTAEAGYLTRRLVDSNQDTVIREVDCGSKEFHKITLEESEIIGEKFETRIYGRTLGEDIKANGKTIAKSGEIIEKETIEAILENDVSEVSVSSVLTCLTEGGICIKCYGKDLGTNKEVQIGTAVGIIAAQSIGEPGTQLTMRTFHMGGVAEGSDITQGLTRVEELFEARTPKSPATLSEVDGIARIKQKGKQVEIHVTSNEPVESVYTILADMVPTVKVNDKVRAKMVIAKSEDQKGTIKALEDGIVKEVTEETITIHTDGAVTKEYRIPMGRTVKIKDKQAVSKGQPLTNGHLDLKQLMHLTNTYTVQKYIVTEVQSIYASQGQSINDKHIEIVARQMLSKIRIVESGDTDFLPGEISDIIRFNKANSAVKKHAKGERLLLGLTRVALHTDSWLSAASFQETIRVLVEASTTNKMDNLIGLKENVIIGKLIPAGETFRKIHDVEGTQDSVERVEVAEAAVEKVKELPII